MTWLIGLAVVVVLGCAADRLQRKRSASDLHAPPAHQPRGVRHLGEAPVRTHHRMGRI